MKKEVYALFKKDMHYKNKWDLKGIFETYEKAQKSFIYKKGFFTIKKIISNKFIRLNVGKGI